MKIARIVVCCHHFSQLHLNTFVCTQVFIVSFIIADRLLQTFVFAPIDQLYIVRCCVQTEKKPNLTAADKENGQANREQNALDFAYGATANGELKSAQRH